MRRILLTMEYLGTAFSGYQVQSNAGTVQEAVEDAIFRAWGERVRITASGRTDAGVHALGQTAHFDTECSVPAERVCLALNRYLPEEVRIKSSREVPADFHARFGVKRKTYLYRMYRAAIPSPTRRDTHAQVPETLNVPAMREALPYLLGEHDFACFMAAGSEVKTTVRTIYAAQLAEEGEDELRFTVTGNGFLYNMVRIIVGTLLEIGRGRPASDMGEIIAGRDRAAAGATAPPQGLYLYKVEY